MANENNLKTTESGADDSGSEVNKADSTLPVHNPLKPDDDKKITQEDIENLQKYKEALTERD
jgi:hypothetical protein